MGKKIELECYIWKYADEPIKIESSYGSIYISQCLSIAQTLKIPENSGVYVIQGVIDKPTENFKKAKITIEIED